MKKIIKKLFAKLTDDEKEHYDKCKTASEMFEDLPDGAFFAACEDTFDLDAGDWSWYAAICDKIEDN